MTATIGTLMPKAHRHEKSVVSQPPSNGPTATMPPIVEPHTANAMPRSRPVNVALRIESVVGRTIAPPMPCSTRDTTRSSPVGESAASTDATANTMTPVVSRRRRPNRSATEPKTSSRAANTSV